jgi:hypothetical protein
MTRTLVIVGCGAAKRDTEAPAKDLYTSTYFAKKRAYAETIGDDWQVLSAEYGLVPHDFVIKPYETHIDDLDDRELDLLAHSVGMDLINLCARKEFDEVRVLAGRSYLDPLREREAFATAPATVRFPLQEADCGGIGEQMQWLDERVAAYGEQQRLMTDGGQCAGDTERSDVRREPDSDAEDIIRRTVSDWSAIQFIMTGTHDEIDGDGLTQSAESLQPKDNAVLEVVDDGETVARFTGTGGAKDA